jgi:hypothetical protein
VTAPPALKASYHTVEYLCGGCDALVLHAEDDQVHSLTIQPLQHNGRVTVSLGRAAALPE